MIRTGNLGCQLEINLKYGYKLRRWDEIEPSFINMVAAIQSIRKQYL